MSTSLHVLSEAIERRQAAVIRTPGRRAGDQIQIAFLADGRPSGDPGFWAELVSGDVTVIDRLIAAQVHVETSFQSGGTRVYFETSLLQRRRAFLRGERILLSWPGQLRVEERRRAERERVPEDLELSAVLVLPEQRQALIPLYVWDLSATGGAFLYPPGKRPPKFETDQPLQIRLRFDGADHEVIARHRNSQTLSGGRVRIGVQFDFERCPNASLATRLQRLVDELRTRRIRNTLGAALTGRGAA